MNKYLVSYAAGQYSLVYNYIVKWDCISEKNIDKFEIEREGTIIAITKLDK